MTMHASGTDSYVLFALAGATYALRSDDIQQLELVSTPTPVPNAPPWVDGVVSVRGQVIPAVSLRARFGFPRVPPDARSRLVILNAHGRTLGLVVDSAREFASIPPEAIGPLPEGIGGMSGRYLRGIARQGERLVLVVDVAELLTGAMVDTDGEASPEDAPQDAPQDIAQHAARDAAPAASSP